MSDRARLAELPLVVETRECRAAGMAGGAALPQQGRKRMRRGRFAKRRELGGAQAARQASLRHWWDAGASLPRMALYDVIGAGYGRTRRADRRIERAIHAGLGDAVRVVNVGAGTGSYEPRDRDVVAVEPSALMIAQRRPDAAPVVQARAESLPFDNGAFDASLAVLTDHHWADRASGLREMRRVARRRAVIFTWDDRFARRFWLVRDYLPEFVSLPGMSIATIAGHLGAREILPVPIPADCQDGFFHAYWARPEAYLAADVRAGISVFARLDQSAVQRAVARLETDLATGAWHEQNADIADRLELDLGYRLLIATY